MLLNQDILHMRSLATWNAPKDGIQPLHLPLPPQLLFLGLNFLLLSLPLPYY
mgnify:CR=1 FL=1